MKKRILMGILGLIVLGTSMNINAETIDSVEEGSNSTNASVTVGAVDTSVYSVEISWSNTMFNWSYNDDEKNYSWKLNTCASLSGIHFDESTFTSYYKERLYTDSYCSTKASENTTYEEVSNAVENYYFDSSYDGMSDVTTIIIDDNSVNASIQPSIKWQSEENYDWTTGTFEYSKSKCGFISEENYNYYKNVRPASLYIDSDCTTSLGDLYVKGEIEEIPDFEENKYYGYAGNAEIKALNTEEIPSDALSKDEFFSNYYRILFKPTIDETKEITTPKSGDTIGIITITIKAAE